MVRLQNVPFPENWVLRNLEVWGRFFVGTVITLVVLVTVVGLAVRRMVRDRKNGKSLQCGGDCSNCRGCH